MPDSAPTPSENAPSPVQNAAFLKPALSRIQQNLELLLGNTVAIVAGEPAALAGNALASLASAPCVVLGVQASGAIDARLLCILPETLAIAMSALAQLKSDQAMMERLAQPTGITPGEREGVKEVASFIVAALGEFAKDSTGGRIVLAPSEPRFIPGDGSSLLDGGEDCTMIEAIVTVSTAPPSKLVIVVPASLAAEWSGPDPKATSVFGSKVARGGPAPAPVPATGAATAAAAAGEPPAAPQPPAKDTPVLWVAGTGEFVAALTTATGDRLALRGFAALPELISVLESEPGPALVVVEVPSGAEFQLDMLAALRRHPRLAASGLVIALESPTRRHVLRCGSLGLLDVIPTDLEPDELGERLLNRARKIPRAKPMLLRKAR